VDLKEIGWQRVDWISQVQDRDKLRVLVNTEGFVAES
jgi:hypothetical protein